MVDLRAAIICTSPHHGNTLKIAEAIAGVLQATILPPEALRAADASRYDLLGWGSGIYFGRHHRSLLQLAETAIALPEKTFLFSTAGTPQLAWLWHRSLRSRLQKRGCRIAGEFCCKGWDTVGPLRLIGGIHRHHPDARDLARAADFAGDLRQRLSEQA